MVTDEESVRVGVSVTVVDGDGVSLTVGVGVTVVVREYVGVVDRLTVLLIVALEDGETVSEAVTVALGVVDAVSETDIETVGDR